MRKLLLCFVVVLVSIALNAQDFARIQLVHELAERSKDYFEGYSSTVIPNTFNYHSFRHDVGASMITRCLETSSPMSWQTAVVPVEFNEPLAGFIWIAAIDMTSSDASFSVWFNGEKRFTLKPSRKANWEVKGDQGSKMAFQSMMLDRHGDTHGYMTLQVPLEWINLGEAQVVKIQGDNSNQSSWIIVYEAKDALSFLQESSGFDALYSLHAELTGSVYTVVTETASALSGNEITLETGKFMRKDELIKSYDLARSEIRVPKQKMSEKITLYDDSGEILQWDFNQKLDKSSLLMAGGVLKNSLVSCSDTGFSVIAERSYMPGLVVSMLALAKSDMAESQIMLMNSSHQDIAWMDSPEKCMLERDTMLLQPLFNRAEIDKNYRFDIEDALMIREYVHRHPDKKDLVRQLFADGRISCGATFCQPYEEMYSGEALARQFYFGARWLKEEFGYEADTYWSVDVPGRTLQMPQLMKKAGVNNLVMTRQGLGFYDWYSPDGSKITGFSNGHYGDSFGPLGDEYYIAADYLSKYSFNWSPFYNEQSTRPVIPVLSDWDMSPAKDYSQLISFWSSLKELKTNDGSVVKVSLPDFKEALAPEMFRAMKATGPVLNELHGERPDLWLYIHGPSHHKALDASREADILLTQAEKLASVNALLDGSFRSYPAGELNEAWAAKIYPDHGWGGKMGLITDDLFRRKFDFARSEAREIISLQLNNLGSRIDVDMNSGRPIVVFNSLGWSRSSEAVYTMSFEPGEARGIRLVDASGEQVSSQLNKVSSYPDGSIQSADIHFVAMDVPSVGYKTYYVQPQVTVDQVPMPKQGKRLENRYYILEFGRGGLSRIFDKELGKELIAPNGFTAGEVFTLRSIGNGAGEFDQVQQPDTVGFDKTGNYRTAWMIEEDGDVYTSYFYKQPIRNAVIEQRVILYKELKKIDFETSVLNWEGLLYREYRMALPVNAVNGKVVYEVPYGKLEVGKDEMKGAAGERYMVDCKDIHPRGMQNWIDVSSDDFGITLSSSVVGVDYVDITGTSSGNTLIQPIFFASRRSCHGEGNDYLQTGDHYFHFSLLSHPAGWRNGYRFGIEANEKLLVAGDMKKYADAGLPEELSFFSLDAGNICLTVIKKAESSDDIIIRAYEAEGKKSSVRLKSFFNIESITPSSLIEYPAGEPIKVRAETKIEIAPFSIETYKLNLSIIK